MVDWQNAFLLSERMKLHQKLKQQDNTLGKARAKVSGARACMLALSAGGTRRVAVDQQFGVITLVLTLSFSDV